MKEIKAEDIPTDKVIYRLATKIKYKKTGYTSF